MVTKFVLQQPFNRMCQPTTHFIFCSCEDKKAYDGRVNPLIPQYKWRLTQYAGSYSSGVMGLVAIPAQDLGKGVTVASVVEALNARNCFDFAYQPTERDCLTCYVSGTPEWKQYFKLTFRDGSWQEGQNPAFSSKETHVAEGKIRSGKLQHE